MVGKEAQGAKVWKLWWGWGWGRGQVGKVVVGGGGGMVAVVWGVGCGRGRWRGWPGWGVQGSKEGGKILQQKGV